MSKGSVSLEGSEGPATLEARPRGLVLVHGTRAVSVDPERLRFTRGRLRDELHVGADVYRIALRQGDHAAQLIAEARLRPGDAFVPTESPFIEPPDDLQRRWLSAWLRPDEDLLAFLETSSTASVDSTLGQSADSTQYFLWTTDRAALVAMHALGDVALVPLAGSLELESRLGADRLRVGAVEWQSKRSNEDDYASLAPVFDAAPEVRRRFVIDLARAKHRGEAVRLAGRNATPQSQLESAILAGAAIPIDALVDRDIPAWVDAWSFPQEAMDRLIATARDAQTPAIRDAALALHAHVRDRRLSKLDDDAWRERIAIDEDYARHLVAESRHEDARQVLQTRRESLPDEDLVAFLGNEDDSFAASHAARVRLLELEAELLPDSADALRHLARLEPLSPARLSACIERDGDARAERAHALFDAYGLSARAPQPRVVPPLDPDAIETLRHPVGRSQGVIAYVQGLVADTAVPDVAHLEDFAPRLEGLAAEVLERCGTTLGVSAPGYRSEGRRARGCRAYPSDDGGFVLLGGEHLRDDHPRFLSPAALHFALGSELAHLRYGHARATSSEVWQGAVSGGLAAVDTLLGAVPVLQTLRFAKHVGRAVTVLRDERSHRVLGWAKKTLDKARDRGASKPEPEAEVSPPERTDEGAHLGSEGLVAAHRLMQLTADRAGLLCCQDPGAAIRAMFILRAEDSTVPANLLADVDSRLASGDARDRELALRVGAVLAFWLSDDYERLAAMRDPAAS